MNSTHSRLYELPSLREIDLPRNNDERFYDPCNWDFSSQGRWLVGDEYARGGSQLPVPKWLNDWLPKDLFEPQHRKIVVDPSVGSVLTRITGDIVVGWSDDDSSVWIETQEYDQCQSLFQLFRLQYGFPIWPLSLTGVLTAALLRKFAQISERIRPASIAA